MNKYFEEKSMGIAENQVMLTVSNLDKYFTLHNQDGVSYKVLDQITMSMCKGECLALSGVSGSGKSTLMRTLYANYLPQSGSIQVNHQGETIEMVNASPHTLLQIRKYTLGYISQFLRVIPRVSALQIVMQPLLDLGENEEECERRAKTLLRRLNVPEHLWSLAPATFSGGEQQRINIARGFIIDYPILLLDEPTASLDETNKQVVVDLINEAKARGSALAGIFHDEDVRRLVADQEFMVA